MMIPALPESLDSYAGWEPSSSSPKIARVSSDISPEQMWSHFISKRRPVILEGHLQDSDWKGAQWTDLDYLRKNAGNVPVKIEPIHPEAGHFGTSVKRKQVSFSEYLDLLQEPKNAGKWYLTTQYVEDDAEPSGSNKRRHSSSGDLSNSASESESASDESDNEPELDTVLPAPTNALSNDFPKNPKILGSLVLQQCNLWLGNSKEGKSSGLHHDFHDNLYILLSGYKRFLLFPPSAHRHLHPRGLVEKVHPNGLIVYAPPGKLPLYIPGRRAPMPIRPDGLVPSDAARWRCKARTRVKQDIDEQAAAAAGEGLKGKHQRKGKAKQTRAQEQAEQALMQAEAELCLCRLDEDGIDPEDDTEDEDNSDVTDSMASIGEEILRRQFESLEEEEEEEEEGEEESDGDTGDVDEQVQDLMAVLPDSMKATAMMALAGDTTALELLKIYVAAAAIDDERSEGADSDDAASVNSDDDDDDEDDGEDEEEEEVEDEVEPSEEAEAERKNGSILKQTSGSNEESDPQSTDGSEDDTEDNEESDATVRSTDERGLEKEVSIRSEKKRKAAANGTISDSPSDEAVGSSRPKARKIEGAHAKKVKIAALPQQIDNQDSTGEDSEEIDSEDAEEGEESDGSDTSGPPLFPEGGDSGSEFGDVDDGEAQLDKLLAMAGADQSDREEDEEDEEEQAGEPPSFSRIPPSVLHEYYDVPSDPSRPRAKSNRANPSRAQKARERGGMEGPLPSFGCPKPLEVFLKPGQMLYLPASWYHEVTSSSSPPYHLTANGNSIQNENQVHMALNYWFHPPDALDFQPVKSAPSSSSANGKEPTVPGWGVNLGESAVENLRDGTGTHERPYRDAEVWDEIARAVDEQIKLARGQAKARKWAQE